MTNRFAPTHTATRSRLTRCIGALALTVASLVAASSVSVASASPVEVAPVVLPPPVEQFDPTRRVLGPISVIGDSVLRGALVSPPNIVDQLAARGWGPIRALGVPGLSTGHVFRSPELTAKFWFDQWRQQGWDPQAVALIIGSNDVGFCAHFDAACMRNSMRSIVDHIGADRDVFVPHINHWFKNEWSIPWNRELDVLVAERPNVHTWAWDVELANGGYELSDVVHLSSNSYRRWSSLTAIEITAALGRSTFVGDNVDVPEAAAAPANFSGLDPVRLVDTRSDPDRRLASDSVLRVAVPDTVAPDATAVALYVTGARSGASGHLQVAACGAPRPATSAVNFAAGTPQGSPTVVALDATREVCVYSSTDVDVTVDLQGFFAPGVGSRLQPTSPVRLLDTRATGRAAVVEVPVDPNADAVAINLTAARAAARGFLTAHSCDEERPSVATLNFAAGQPIASSAFVATNGSDSMCIFSSAPVDVIVDLTGTFADGAGLSFVAAAPTRMLDTRFGVGGWLPFANDHRPVDVRVAPADAAAVTGTLTLIRPFAQGHLTAFGCGSMPSTSSVNAAPGAIVANALTVATAADGRLCVATSERAQVVFDLAGWWTATG